ncbi:MAG TPA: tRNA pseudouridine(55) synthase TruB [Candidatus Omnitrophica bacterium]|nr:tRNA pseudouridine(55) synthase TruB [Candidatus Omnitrophota bacterium]
MNAPVPLTVGQEVNGILLVDKPTDWTSHDVCAFVRGRFRIPKVGHAGTLDPNATGLLVLLLGRFTRQSADWSSCDKDYEGLMELGVETDSQDRQGKVLKEMPADHITEDVVKSGMKEFVGEIMQTPPMVSAVKHQGKRLYELARKGKVVERESRPAIVYKWNFLEKNGNFVRFECSVSKGTYVRTLADDLGRKLGCGAVLAELRRTRCGPFKIQNSVTIEQIKAMQPEDFRAQVLVPGSEPHQEKKSPANPLQGNQ